MPTTTQYRVEVLDELHNELVDLDYFVEPNAWGGFDCSRDDISTRRDERWSGVRLSIEDNEWTIRQVRSGMASGPMARFDNLSAGVFSLTRIALLALMP